MLINRYTCGSEDASRVLEAQLKMMLAGGDNCTVDRSKTIVCGQLVHSVELKIGKDNGFYITTELNRDTGFGTLTMDSK